MGNEFCSLYIVKDTLSGDIKIGISNNPKERKKEIQNEYNVGEVIGLSITWFFTRKEALLWEKLFQSEKKLTSNHLPTPIFTNLFKFFSKTFFNSISIFFFEIFLFIKSFKFVVG